MTRFTIFLFFFTLSTMAQITITGKVFDEKGKPFSKAIVSNGRKKVYTDAQGNYTIQAKLFDILYFEGEAKEEGYKIDKQYYYVIKNIPHQKYEVQLVSVVIHKDIVYPYTLSFSFYLDDSKVEKSNEEAFKERVRNGEFYTYEIRTWDEMPKEIEQISMYNVFVYTQDYYNEHIKNKSKKK